MLTLDMSKGNISPIKKKKKKKPSLHVKVGIIMELIDSIHLQHKQQAKVADGINGELNLIWQGLLVSEAISAKATK